MTPTCDRTVDPRGLHGGGGGPRVGSSGYTSGRVDTALTAYASMMAFAAAGVVVALRRVVRRQPVATGSSDASVRASGA